MTEEKPNFHVLVATPCYGGQMMRGYAQSILNLQRLCDSNGVKLDVLTIGNESLITRARNFYVSLILAKKEYTHLLFIDADISFNPLNVFRMLMANKDVVAGAYPKKGVSWEKIIGLVKEGGSDRDFVEPASYDYAINIITENDQGVQKVPIQNGFLKVSYAATGFMLVKREVLEKMAREFPNLKYVNDVGGYDTQGNKDYFYALFDCYIDPQSRRYLSEDYAFCKRWLGMNGEIWVDLSCNLTHSGTFDFRGSYLKSIERGIRGEDNKPYPSDLPVLKSQSANQSLDDKLKEMLGGGQSIEVSQQFQQKAEPTPAPKVEQKSASLDDKLKDLLTKGSQETKPEVKQEVKSESKELSIEDRLKALLTKDSGGKLNKVQVI